MSDPEPGPLIQRNFAPELQHFGKHFVYHGRSGVLTSRIDVQDCTHDGHVIVGETILHGIEPTRPAWRRISEENNSLLS